MSVNKGSDVFFFFFGSDVFIGAGIRVNVDHILRQARSV